VRSGLFPSSVFDTSLIRNLFRLSPQRFAQIVRTAGCARKQSGISFLASSASQAWRGLRQMVHDYCRFTWRSRPYFDHGFGFTLGRG